MAILSLPLSFNNSFWTQDYRRGLEVLYRKLEQGVAENQEIIDFIRARSAAEAHLADTLINNLTSRRGTPYTFPSKTASPHWTPGTGFNADDGASLLLAFRGLQAESTAQGQAHRSIAKELIILVADPFEEWSEGYKARTRIRQSKTIMIGTWLKDYEQAREDVAKLKQQYILKMRRADDAEDESVPPSNHCDLCSSSSSVKFAPLDSSTDKYTSSPRIRPLDGRKPLQRSATVSERISASLKQFQKKSADALAAATTPSISHDLSIADDGKSPSKVDKGKGKEQVNDDMPQGFSLPPISPPDDNTPSVPPKPLPRILLAGLSFPPSSISQLLTRAAAELPLRPVKFPLLGEYQDAFTGEEFVTWLKDNVEGFGGNLDHAEEAARTLTEAENVLRRLGELGNQFESSDEAFYQFRSRAFNLDGKEEATSLRPDIAKRTGAFVNLVSKALAANANGEPTHVRARQDAEEADRNYRIAVRKFDRQRLRLEEKVEETLKVLQHWESERLQAIKTVLLQFQGTLANLPKAVYPSIERQATLIAAYQPESDLTALIERYRTGPFRPDPQISESFAHEESDVVFGIDLRKWAEGGWFTLTSGEEKKDIIPLVVTALLNGLDEAYPKMPNDDEKRKTWIYEVPLLAVHYLREALNAIPPDQPIPAELLTKYDAPVLASTLKLWALELDPPLALYEGWDEFRKLYPSVGASSTVTDGQVLEAERLKNVASALQKLPRAHLYVLDAIVKHLKSLMDITLVKESNEVFITKLALSFGRTILRPKQETELSIQDRHPTLLFIDLLKHYDTLLPPTISRKKRESERKVPIRKRTAPIDLRVSRSRISIGADVKQLLAAQQAAAQGVKSPPLPPPPLPQDLQSDASQSVPSPISSADYETPRPSPPANQSQTLPPSLQNQKTPPPPPAQHQSLASGLTLSQLPGSGTDDLSSRLHFKESSNEDTEEEGEEEETEEEEEEEEESEEEEEEEEEPKIPISLPSQLAIQPQSLAPHSRTLPLPPQAVTSITPPTPQKRSNASLDGRGSPASNSTPPNEDIVLGTGKVTISRHGSGQTGQSPGIRGPRFARGGRGGSNVQSMISSINRTSMSGSPSPQIPPTPNKRVSGSPVIRSSGVSGRNPGMFSRRTMASDAEDEVIRQKKEINRQLMILADGFNQEKEKMIYATSRLKDRQRTQSLSFVAAVNGSW
ncbi:Rho-GTPase-activating protein 8 [Leucoagaricus gongylophorus]